MRPQTRVLDAGDLVRIEREPRRPVLRGGPVQRRRAGETQAVGYDAFELLAVDADPVLRPLQLRAQLFEAAGQCGIGFAYRFEVVMGAALGVRLLDAVDFRRDPIGTLALDAAGEEFRDAALDDRRGTAELAADDLGLFDEPAQHAVLRALRIDEIAAVDATCRLQFAIDAAVALFEAARVPRQVEMEQVAAMALQVQAFARRVGRHEDAQRIVGRRGIEGPLDLFAAIGRGGAGEHGDACLGVFGIGDRFAQQPLDPAPRILIFGKDQQAALAPGSAASAESRHHFASDPVDEMPDAGVRIGAASLGDLPHFGDRREFGFDLRRPIFAGTRGAGQGRGRDRLILFGAQLVLAEEGGIVVGADAGQEAHRVPADARRRRRSAVENPAQRRLMHGERAREGLDRRQQPLLQPDPDEFRPGPPARRFSRQASTAQLAVVGELCGEHQFRRGLGQAVDDDGLDNALGKALSAAAQILLQTADHDRFELRRLDLLAADEALRIENFHQRGKAVRVPVMRRCRQEQAVLESRRQLADCLRDLRVRSRICGRSPGRHGAPRRGSTASRAGSRAARRRGPRCRSDRRAADARSGTGSRSATD